MIRKDIVKNVSARLGIDEEDISAIMTVMLDEISKGIGSGEGVFLRNFGTFKVCETKNRVINDINGGMPMLLPIHRRVKFVAGKNIAGLLK